MIGGVPSLKVHILPAKNSLDKSMTSYHLLYSGPSIVTCLTVNNIWLAGP